MSMDSLGKFVDEKFLRDETIQSRLKETDSLDEFAEEMVSLSGNDYDFTTEEVKALVHNEVDKQKERMDEEGQELLDEEMETNWKDGKFVETGILNLRGDDVLPLYP